MRSANPNSAIELQPVLHVMPQRVFPVGKSAVRKKKPSVMCSAAFTRALSAGGSQVFAKNGAEYYLLCKGVFITVLSYLMELVG